MARFRLSCRAEADLLDIGDYTLRTWGEDQAVRHTGDLEACCLMRADSPRSGRTCDHVRPGLRRMESGRHAVFYREDPRGILVSRILHQSTLPDGRVIDNEEEPN